MDRLDPLVASAVARVASGYYEDGGAASPGPSMARAIRRVDTAVVAELKLASPVAGRLAERDAVPGLLRSYVRGGACGLSVLTEPGAFDGSLGALRAAAATKEAVLMKDFVLDARQIACAARLGASAVLLIQAVMGRRGGDALAATLIQAAHDHGLEVVLEASTAAEYVAAKETEADILGINHRDLRTMAVDAAATSTILTAHGKDRPVMAMSGISTRREIEGLKAAGADAFLVGSALVTAPDPEARLRTLVGG